MFDFSIAKHMFACYNARKQMFDSRVLGRDKRGNCDEGKEEKYAGICGIWEYGGSCLADFGRRQEKAVYRDRRWKGAERRLWYGDRADRYRVSGQCTAWIAGDLPDFSRPAAFFFIYSGIFSGGSVGVSVNSDRCISGTFAFHFWSERVY